MRKEMIQPEIDTSAPWYANVNRGTYEGESVFSMIGPVSFVLTIQIRQKRRDC